MNKDQSGADTARIDVIVTSHGGAPIEVCTPDISIHQLPDIITAFKKARYTKLNGRPDISPVGQSVHGDDIVRVTFNSDSPERDAAFEKRKSMLEPFLIAALDNRLPGQVRENAVYHGGIQPTAYAAALLLPQIDDNYAAALDNLLETTPEDDRKPGNNAFTKSYARLTERAAMKLLTYHALRPLLAMAPSGQTEAGILSRVVTSPEKMETLQKSYKPDVLRDPLKSLFDLDREFKLIAALGLEQKSVEKMVDSGNRMPVRYIYG